MEVLKGKLRFSTGREIPCLFEQVSLDIGVGGVDDRLGYGSDGAIYTRRDSWGDIDDPTSDALTDPECIELADHMIAEWTGFRDLLLVAAR